MSRSSFHMAFQVRMLKRFSNNIHNAASWFEGTVLEEVTVQSLQDLQTYHPSHCHLLSPNEASDQCKALLVQVGVVSANLPVSLKASVMGNTVHRGAGLDKRNYYIQ